MDFNIENPLSNVPGSDSEILLLLLPCLFEIESDHMPASCYPQILVSTNSDISVRRNTISLISAFSHHFHPSLSYLAVNYLDRFLSTQSIQEGKPWILRLLAVSCLSLAMKMSETEFSVADLQQDGGFIFFDVRTIRRMEFLILGALKWRMRSITPFSFLNSFVSLFEFKDPPSTQALKSRAMEIIFQAQIEIKLLEFKPSIIAASALLCSSQELFPLQFPCFKRAISSCYPVNKDELGSCYSVMQEIEMKGYESSMDMASGSSSPANVLDRLLWSSSDTEESQNLQWEMKRRKLETGFKSDNNKFHQSSSQEQRATEALVLHIS